MNLFSCSKSNMNIRKLFSHLFTPPDRAYTNTQKILIGGNHSIETYLFRDQVIEELPKIITERFPEGANIICYACSNGHEPYSLAMKLCDIAGKDNVKSKYPISGFDRCEDIIKICRDGQIILPSNVDQILKAKTLFPFSEAFSEGFSLQNSEVGKRISPACSSKGTTFKLHTVNKPLREFVTFESGDLMNDVKSFSFNQPVIFMFRNVWFSFTFSQVQYLAHHLSKNLPRGSLLIIGDRDQMPRSSLGEISNATVSQIIESKGFKRFSETSGNNSEKFIFEKI